MSKNHDVQELLRELGESSAPAPSAEFADGLERRLRSMVATEGDYVAPRAPLARPRPRLRPVLVPAFGVVAALAAGAYALGGGSADDPGRLATETTMTTSTTIDGGPTSSRSLPASTAPAPTTAPPETAPAPLPSTTAPAVTAPSTTAPPPVPPTTRVEATRPTSSTTTVARRGIELTARRDESDGVRLQWTAHPDATRYIAVRTAARGATYPPEPQYPAVAPAVVVAETTGLAERDAIGALSGTARYRVFALNAQGRVVAQSPIVDVAFA